MQILKNVIYCNFSQCIVNKDYGDLRQVSEAIQPMQPTHYKMDHQVHEEAVDLSCHEMDASLDHGGLEDRIQHNSIDMEFHGRHLSKT